MKKLIDDERELGIKVKIVSLLHGVKSEKGFTVMMITLLGVAPYLMKVSITSDVPMNRS